MASIVRTIAVFFILLLGCFVSTQAGAVSIIRDEEIESAIKDVVRPIFKAAGLNPNNIRIIIVNDPEINAFVSGGMNIFINTGLLTLSEKPEMLIGVVAHETGHIKGGHLARQGEELKKASIQTAVGYILGIATALSGAPDAGQAIVLGSGHVADRRVLAYSRKQEESADQFALQVLDKLSFTPEGLLQLLEKLDTEQSLLIDNPNPYTLTHPLSRERINHIRVHMESEKIHYTPVGAEVESRYERAITKLQAYLDPPEKTLLRFPDSDGSVVAQEARAIAYYRQLNFDKSLQLIDNLISSAPRDPFFYELKGQVLFEHGKVKEALPSYQQALDLLPSSLLLRLQLGFVQVSTEDPGLLDVAIKNLNQVAVKEPGNALAWRQLAIAYGRRGEIGMSNLALAEEALLLGKKEDALRFTDLAGKSLPKDSPSALRAKDIRMIAEKK